MNKNHNIVLYVDDEKYNLELFLATFEDEFDIIITTSTQEARKILANNHIKVVISDLRMPDEDGVEFIQNVSPQFQDVFFVLLTAYLDGNAALSAINQGKTYKYLLKPWDTNILRDTINDAIYAYDLKFENRALVSQLKEKNAELENTMNQLKEREKQFFNIFYYSSDGIIIHNRRGQLLLANPALFKLMEISEDEAHDPILIDKSRHGKFYRQLTEICKKSLHTYEFQSETLNGNEKFLEINTAPIDYFGELVALSIIRDITERKQDSHKIFNAVILAEEKERNRLAGELHDGLGPNLSAIKMYIEWLSDKTRSGDPGEILELAANSINEAIFQVRNISHSLSPHILEKFGLIPALQSHIELLKQTSDIEINLNSNIKNRIKPDIELTLYRVLKECLNNTLKHAQAKNIFIVFVMDKNKLSVIYSDNGIGFDTEADMEKKEGIGLYNIQNRISSLGGICEILSAKGHGTRIKFEFKNAE